MAKTPQEAERTGERVDHVIYGRGSVLDHPAEGNFVWVRFDTPRNERMTCLAVGRSALGRRPE